MTPEEIKAVPLKLDQKLTFYLDAKELEVWFKTCFGKNLEFAMLAECDCGNLPSSMFFHLDGEGEEGWLEVASRFIHGTLEHHNMFINITNVLQVLCRDGFLAKGNYIIEVDL